MYIVHVYNGHYENGVFLRDTLKARYYFNNMMEVRAYLGSKYLDLDNFDYLIESPSGSYNSIYRFDF